MTSAARERVLDAVLVATLVAVPLVFTTSMRTFAAAKLGVLELGVGIALVLAGFVAAPARSRKLLAGVAVLALALAARPDLEGLAAAGYFVALGGLAWLVAQRTPGWSDRTLARIVALVLVVELGLSLSQSLGIGVLAASSASFGGTHGVVVGTVGNPVELTWMLALAVVLLHGLAPGRASWIAIACALWVVLVDRSRATLGVGVLALAVGLARRPGPLPRIGAAALLAGAAIAVLQWGGGTALRGRAFLLELGARMVVGARGVPQGPGAFARHVPAAQASALASSPDDAVFVSQLEHAHCDAIELAYELGLPGLALVAWLAWSIVVALRRDPSPRRRTAAATLAFAALLGIVGYPLLSPAVASVVALALGLALAPASRATASRWPHPIGCTVVGAALIVLAIRQSTAELALTRALAAHVAGDDAAGRAHAHDALARFPGADAWFLVGNFALAAGDRTRAALAYQRSIALRPRAEASANLARALAPPK